MQKKLFLLFITIPYALLMSMDQTFSGLGFSSSEKPPVAFFSASEQKKKLLEKLQADQATHNKQLGASIAKLRDEILRIDRQMDDVKYSLSYVRNEQEAVLKNKKITIFGEMKQTLSGIQEELKETADVLSAHIKTTKEYLAAPSSLETEQRAAFSWQELREAQLETGKLQTKFEVERKKREDIVKQKITENESISSLQKRLEVSSKEHAKTLTEEPSTSRATAGIQLKLSNEIFNLDTQLLQKKIELSKTKITRLDLELAAKSDEVELLDIQLQNKKYILSRMEKGLSLTSYDVEGAKAEANLANQKAARIKETISKKIDAKKVDKERIVVQRTNLQRQLKDFLGQDRETPESVAYHVLQSEIHKCTSTIHVLDREIDFLTIKRELADLAVHGREIVAHDVDVRYKLFRGRASAGDLAQTFKNHKDIALSLFKKMKDKHDEVLKSYGDRSQALEEIKIIQTKINAIAPSLFANHEQELSRINRNLEESRQAVTAWFSLSQEYISASTEYLARYEKILSQYNLILENLENHRSRLGLWKRSRNALTLNDLTQALGEAETFIKHLFLEAPKHLSLSALFTSIKALTWRHTFNILLLIIFFICSIALFKFCLILLTRLLSSVQSKNKNDKSLLYATIGLGALHFLQENSILVGSWLFFYLHITLNFHGLFGLLKPYALPYYISLFYLLSIALFIFLARNLLFRLKELNKKISFLSFPENFQDRIELLLATYCYTFAIIAPLRQAATYLLPDGSLALTQLLSALQTSVLILLPMIIFSKEHVLYFLPDASTVSKWIKKQLDVFYYPLMSFVIMLFLLSRSFVGYGNLAAFLSYSIPLTILVFYGMLLTHIYIRKYAVFMFMKESDEEISDKFEHAKTYYGFFVIFSFLILLLLSIFIIARLWEFNVSFEDFRRFLSETMVVPIGVDGKFGFIQFITLIIFVVGGFFASSIVHRLILNRLFDILRTEPGTQNTVTKIVHYFTICLSILLGFISIRLAQLIWYIGTTLAVGLGFALKDILSDYVAGFFVLIERPIEVGNYVRLDNNIEMQGVVHKIDARTTTIMTRLNHSVIIANKELVGKTISNWGKGRFAVGFEVRVLVDYDSNIDEVKKILQEVLQSNPIILRVPNIIVRIDDFEEAGVYFLARAFISARRVQEQWMIAASLREELFKAFRAKGIRFGLPQRVIQVGGKSVSGGPVQFSFDQ